MAVLRTIKGLPPGQVFTLDKEAAVLGRHPDCDIVLEIGAVSRNHAKIVAADGEFFVEDLNSRNGTFVNDERVEGRRKLADNDQLRICDVVMVFHKGPTDSPGPGRRGPPGADATIMFDDDRPASGSTVMSKLDVSGGASGLRLTVNAEAKLKALLEIGRSLGRAVGLNEVLSKVLDSLFAIFLQADRGFLVLRDQATERLIPKAVKHRRGDSDEHPRISRTILNEVIASREAILSADAVTDSRFEMSASIADFHIRSMMCVPLVASQGQVLGVLQIDTVDPRHRFTRDDLEVLASVACQAAVAVENAQLQEIALQEQVLQRELAVAHKVQRGFLPSRSPSVEGYEFFDFYEPARHLGGDYFDYIPLPGGRLVVALGDVSGKGVPAALLMAKLSAEARYCLVSEPSPAAAVFRLNNVFCDSAWEDRFITLVLAVLDPAQHEVTIVNAGHMAPLLRTAAGTVEEVSQGGAALPLGVDNDVDYDSFTLALAPGDSLTLYTDGFSEAMNMANEFYGADRLRAGLAAASGGVAALGQHVLDDVRRFVGSRPQADDMCVTCFGRVR